MKNTHLLISWLLFLAIISILHCHAQQVHNYTFVVQEASFTRLCSTKNILTINGQFPGPTIYANKGDTIIVDVHNNGNQNITIHWHGVKQPRNPWSDGPEYITQCPIQPGASFSQKIILSTEEGTLWWHAHSDWNRATVHGALIVYPKNGTSYPFSKPAAEVPIIIGEWWKKDITDCCFYTDVLNTFVQNGGDPEISDAYLINGQPGDFHPCSTNDTFRMNVDYGKTYLLRMINVAMQDIVFFAIANHSLTVVGTDAAYTKQYKSDYIAIAPGQTIDVLLEANQNPNNYYMASRVYSDTVGVSFDNTTTSAIVQYNGNYTASSPPPLPDLPIFNDTNASVNFTGSLRSLADQNHPCLVPTTVNTKLLYTISVNTFPCPGNSCSGPNGSRLSASVNNISFVLPTIDLLSAYYNNISGVYGIDFPDNPPLVFNYTADYLPLDLETPTNGTKVKVIEYNSTVELILQGTNVVGGTDHPIHLHGYSFYMVGWGFGNFDKDKDPSNFNLVDPPMQNTISVPKNGWSAVRFKATNPGVWFMHCHLERHATWGMEMAFIVKNGQGERAQLLPPPSYMPPC